MPSNGGRAVKMATASRRRPRFDDGTVAAPLSLNSTGTRAFWSDQTGVIYYKSVTLIVILERAHRCTNTSLHNGICGDTERVAMQPALFFLRQNCCQWRCPTADNDGLRWNVL